MNEQVEFLKEKYKVVMPGYQNMMLQMGEDGIMRYKTPKELGLEILPKFKVVGDPNNANKRFSTDVIVSSLNQGAKNVGVFDDNGPEIVYDCLGSGYENVYKNIAAKIVCYELPFPDYVVKNCGQYPIIGVSRDNVRFMIDGGINPQNASYIHLGVDTSNTWKPIKKKYLLDKFVVLSYTESLARSGLEILLEGFKLAFQGNMNAVLFIKDRNATSQFIEYANKYAKDNNFNLKYENRHIGEVEDIKEVFRHADCHIYLNRSTTFGCTLVETMACGITTLSPTYSGPRDYILPDYSGIEIDYDITCVNSELDYLISLGMRNFFFPCRQSDYWCRPKKESVAEKLRSLYNNRLFNQKIGYQGSEFIKQFSWERSALMLSEVLNKKTFH